ncbi:MAG: hypothetical protein WAL64_10325 [Candidatus Dormiibacterota bacterium]
MFADTNTEWFADTEADLRADTNADAYWYPDAYADGWDPGLKHHLADSFAYWRGSGRQHTADRRRAWGVGRRSLTAPGDSSSGSGGHRPTTGIPHRGLIPGCLPSPNRGWASAPPVERPPASR